MRLKGKNGTSIELLTKKIKKELKLEYPEIKRKDKKNKVIKRVKDGRLTASDWNYVYCGLSGMRRLMLDKFDNELTRKIISKEDTSRLRIIILEYKNLIDNFMDRIMSSVMFERQMQEQIESLYEYSQIAQAARDGIILKQEEKEEFINGEKKTIKYDTTMSAREAIRIIRQYEKQVNAIYSDKLTDYLGLGLAIAGVIGTILKNDKQNEVNSSFIALKSASQIGTELLKKMIEHKLQVDEKWKKADQIRTRQEGIKDDLLENEQINETETNAIIELLKAKTKEENKIENQIKDDELFLDTISSLTQALFMGTYISRNVLIRENGKLDGKSLANALISMKANEMISSKIYSLYMKIEKNKDKYKDFESLCKQTQDIISQMEEKVYPLKGAEKQFDSFEIKDLDAKFYPKMDYETGKVRYATNIKIPEFSMKRGDIVLLSGVSGAGKSTFLRLLKRGDINNRKVIKLSNEEEVDNLGNQFISFRPSMDLGNESSVLQQITGKKNVSDLSKKEKIKLHKILEELHLEFPNLIEQLSTRKFMEFSTGQQRRLILSKLFYRIDDGESIVIVDEPVGNVEDKLIKEQLEMIKRYAMRKNVMLLLTTHRLDLAENLATKRYHINENGIMEQMEVQKQDKERD